MNENHDADPDAGERPAHHQRWPSRRAVLLAGAGALASAALPACGADRDPGPAGSGAQVPTTAPSGRSESSAATVAPTPECVDDDDATPSQTEGPYFKPSSPERADLRSGVSGSRLVLSGVVLTTACRPVAGALLDFWQADADGNYDNSGFRLRGHVFTDAQGRYRIDTVVPGLYPGRTRHLHVKAQARSGPVLTTQLYLPGEAQNSRDRLFRPECVITVTDAPEGGKAGTFTFVLGG